jgi:hypothetical protein
MKYLYLILGMVLSFNLTLWAIDPILKERDLNIVRVQSLQSCYFASVKFANMDPDKSSEFCNKHKDFTVETFHDIAVQMDKITDEQFSPINYYSNFLKNKYKELTLKSDEQGQSQ